MGITALQDLANQVTLSRASLLREMERNFKVGRWVEFWLMSNQKEPSSGWITAICDEGYIAVRMETGKQTIKRVHFSKVV